MPKPLILVAGSSIFEQWTTVGELNADLDIRNVAVGGTQTPYWLETLPAYVADMAPAGVFLYCGSNDINAERTPDEIIGTLKETHVRCRSISPKLWFWYCGIIKAPQKLLKWNQVDLVNTGMVSFLSRNSIDVYLEPNTAFFNPGEENLEDRIRSELYVDDGLHLTDQAYAELSIVVKPQIDTWLESINLRNSREPHPHV